MECDGNRTFLTPIGRWDVLCECSAVVTAPLLLQSGHALFSTSARHELLLNSYSIMTCPFHLLRNWLLLWRCMRILGSMLEDLW